MTTEGTEVSGLRNPELFASKLCHVNLIWTFVSVNMSRSYFRIFIQIQVSFQLRQGFSQIDFYIAIVTGC